MSALEARRQAAREAYHDELKSGTGGYYRHTAAAEAAIETATRVRITPEVIDSTGIVPKDLALVVLTVAFRAAGFEVEESAFVCPPWCGVDGPKCANPKHREPQRLLHSPRRLTLNEALEAQHEPDSGTPITDHVYRGGNQVGDLCNHVYPINDDGWPGMRCATPESAHLDRHPQQAPRKDTLPS